MFQGVNRLHFIGIGGVGMSALANILIDRGYEVSGSDISASHVTEQLAEHGAKIFIGHAAKNLGDAEAVVVSSAIREDNPEIVEAKRRGLRRFHRSDVNSALVNTAKGIAVSGSHGKTTTTSMIGLIIEHAGLDPTIVIGGQVDYLQGGARSGRGEFVVSEADESDGSFLTLHPYIAVVTNVEDDHLDYYGTQENILKAFRQFIENTDRETGYAVVCGDDENIRAVTDGLDRRIITYSIDGKADYRAENICQDGSETSFDVVFAGKTLGRVRLNIPGRHNVLDALASITAGLLAGIPFSVASSALSFFHGAKRRFETKGRVGGVWVVDDYAHHPTEIVATLKAAKETRPGRIICAFQPHRYSRTKLLRDEFATAFFDADILILTDVYSAGEAKIPGVGGATIFAAVEEATGRDATYIADRADIAPYIASLIHEGDLVLTMGAGDIYKTGEELLSLLAKKPDGGDIP